MSWNASSTFVAIDTETTGFGPDARIVELAAVRYVDGVETERFCSLINPGIPMPEAATAVNGITDEMLASAPPSIVVLPAFLEFVGRDDMVGHNIEFDLRMLRQELERVGLPPMASEWACTLRMARSSLRLPSYKLGAVAEHLGVTATSLCRACQGRGLDGFGGVCGACAGISGAHAHRALADALAAGAVFLRLEAR